MEVVPIKYGSVNFQKCHVLNNRLLLGIDIGFSMTKIMFLHKDNQCQLLDDKCDHVTLNYGLFNDQDFSESIKWTKERLYSPDNPQYTVPVTGSKAWRKKGIIESILGLQTEHVDYSLSILAGHRLLIEEIGLENLVFPPVEVPSYGVIESKFLDNFAAACDFKEESENYGTDSFIFPCLISSESGFLYFDGEGKGETIGYTMIREENILGLSKCLFDVNMYDQLVLLSSEGVRDNVDSQVKELLGQEENSPYGKIPGDIPVFPFGKCMDLDKGSDGFKMSDVATSLIGLFCVCTHQQSAQICQLKRMKKIYMTDSIFRSEVFQRELKRSIISFPLGLEFDILDCAYVGALGTMIC